MKWIFYQKDEDTNIPYEFNYIQEKGIYKSEIAAYVYCRALDMGNMSSQNDKEMSNSTNDQIAFGKEKCLKNWSGKAINQENYSMESLSPKG